jgi:hypothetical protein
VSIAALLVGGKISKPLLRRIRPAWTRPFIQEFTNGTTDLPPEDVKRPWIWTIVLGGLAFVALASELIELGSGFRLHALFLMISWASARHSYVAKSDTNILQALFSLLILINRPRSCSATWLAFYIPVSIVHLSFHMGNVYYSKTVRSVHGINTFVSFVSLATMFAMPFRPASWPAQDISATGSTPTVSHRSPEDNLRMYQFLSVSWISPLMKIGKMRTLDEPDVWLLPFQFQHRRLHEAFRVLKGSVLHRLIRANALDFVVLSAIALVQLGTGKSC